MKHSGYIATKTIPPELPRPFGPCCAGLKSLPVYLPDLNRVLREYPNVDLANTRTSSIGRK